MDTLHWTNLELTAQEDPMPGQAYWTLQSVKLSHLPVQNIDSSGNAVRLVMRGESWRLWHRLKSFPTENNANKTLWLSGPPGIGKSTLLFGWIHYIASNCSTMWVHRIGSFWHVAMMRGASARYTVVNALETSAESTILNMCSEVTVVVLDALREKLKNLLLAMRDRHPNIFIVISTSYHPGGFSSEESVVVPYDSHVMLSWKLAEYETALDMLFPTLTVDELHERYCYAGGCPGAVEYDQSQSKRRASL